MSRAILVPVRSPDGGLAVFSCVDCSKKNGLYCERHNVPCVGFEDQTTACLFCIEELVKFEHRRANEVAEKVKNSIDEYDRKRLRRSAKVSAQVTGSSEDIAILRFVASRAIRDKVSIEHIIDWVKKEKTCECLICRV